MLPSSLTSAIALSNAIAGLPGLPELLGCPVRCWTKGMEPMEGDVVLAWGFKPSAVKAQAFAKKRGLPLLRLEDGFLRSIELGQKESPLSIVLDDTGIYYNATESSRLERLIPRELSESEVKRARNLVAAWVEARVTKYNAAREYCGVLPERFVLVVDQTAGDVSIEKGMASQESFTKMLEAAICENPGVTVLLKVHPEVFAGTKQGHFDLDALRLRPEVLVIGEDTHPVSFLEKALAVYVVTSQMGFEALMRGKRVRVFGMPFYAGWGLTEDQLPAPARRRQGRPSLEGLVHAALIEYPVYIHPEGKGRCEVEDVLEWLGLQVKLRNRFPKTVHAVGFSLWKRPILSQFVQGSEITFHDSHEEVPAGATVMVWGMRNIPTPEGGEVIRVEDGFLRSAGLGADLTMPHSWVFDRSGGIYYHAGVCSDLERLLMGAEFTPELLGRARGLIAALTESGVTKYNTGRRCWKRPEGIDRVILVPGQVESDASIRFGSPSISSNLDLLKRVREAHPDAYLLYKPHPDVEAGLRHKGAGEKDVTKWCDEVLRETSIAAIFPEVDEIHVLTSLAGFEGLLRGRKVVCYGQPFYAGWGLTRDIYPIQGRTRTLLTEELVAGVLILYPTYLNHVNHRFTSPEQTLEAIQKALHHQPPGRPGLGRRLLRRILGFFKGDGPRYDQ